MNRLRAADFCLFLACLTTALTALRGVGSEPPSQTPTAMALAQAMVESSNRDGGICVIVGAPDADLAVALGRQGNFVVHALCDTDEQCKRMRQSLLGSGRYGTVSATHAETARLPYVDSLINILVVHDFTARQEHGTTLEEIARVLTPLGVAFLDAGDGAPGLEKLPEQAQQVGLKLHRSSVSRSWLELRKPWPAEIDQWTHYLHGPDGNPVAQDRVVGPPEHYQWVGAPQWQRSHESVSSISTLVTANGRLFYIVDEAPISLTGQHPLPDKWSLSARDAFNGVDLWKVPIRRWGWREWKDTWFSNRPGDFPLNLQKRLVAVGDRVYVTLGYHAPVSQLDARTGEILQTYAGTEGTREILLSGRTLILAIPSGDTVRVMAVEADTGNQRWISQASYRGTTVDYLHWSGQGGGVEPVELDPSLNIATDGQAIALIDGPDIVCLDFKTGTERWRAAFPSDPADLTAGGTNSEGNLWNGTMIVREGVVLHASPGKLAAFAATDGNLLWERPKKYLGHLWYAWKDVFVIDGLAWTWSDQLDTAVIKLQGGGQQRSVWPRTVNGYDLHTGDVRREVDLGPIFRTYHHHRCYRNKATTRYILASRRGTEYVDLEQGKHTVHNWVRGTCHMGMMPANGLQYAPPHPCQCYIEEKLNGMNALAAARTAVPTNDLDRPRLTQGPTYAELQDRITLTPDTEDWPTFRADRTRSGSVPTRIADDAALRWSVYVGDRVSAPIVADGMVFAALVDQHQVVCLDADSGVGRWQFPTGARVDSPPTYHDGTVLFGSADGSVYCLRASDGQLAWEFRAAPREQLMGAFGQLESTHPVHGSVLVQDQTAYFAAGRSSQLDGGIYLYGLDVRSGQVRCSQHLEGPDYELGNFEENYALPMGALPDVLLGDGQRIYMRNVVLDNDLQIARGRPDTGFQTRAGLLEDSYFKRTPWTADGEYARLIVRDNRSVYYVRMFDTLRALDPTVFFTPGRQGYLLFSKATANHQHSWRQRIPVRIRAMLAAQDRLVVAGPPDVVDPQDPLGAFEGRLGGAMYLIDSTSGEHKAAHQLAAPPVFNGVAAARGRLYVALENGNIACYAGP